MPQKKLSKVIGFCLLSFVLCYFIYKKEKVLGSEIDTDKIEDFDLILSQGQSVQSKLVGLLNLSMDDYSHIGILIKENNKVFVLHSTPDGTKMNGIRFDDLQTFIDLSDVSGYKVLRYQNISTALSQKLRIEFSRYKSIQAPFDYDFDNFDNKKIYCSELVWLIFKNSGLLESCGFDLKKPIYPKYFLKINKFNTVNLNKTSP